MLVHPNIDPVAIALGPIKIHWYGIAYLVGFVAAWWLGRRRIARKQTPLSTVQLDDLIFWCALGVVLGGRLGYALFYNFERVVDQPLWLLRVWEGGMSFHGGLIGVLLAAWLYARRTGHHIGDLFDLLALLTPIGLGMGRIGNFIGQELWGRPTDLPWGMIFQHDPLGLARHPSQLYQATMEGLFLFIALHWFARGPRPRLAVSGLFLILYGASRFVVEFFREPDAHIGFDAFGWLTRGQLLSLPMTMAGILLMLWAYRSLRRSRPV